MLAPGTFRSDAFIGTVSFIKPSSLAVLFSQTDLRRKNHRSGAATKQAELFWGYLVLRNVKRLFLLLGLLLTACGTVPQSHGGPVQDQVSLIDALRKSVTVDITAPVAQPFLHPNSGTIVRLSGGTLAAPADVQLFEYASTSAAAA